MRRWKYLVPLAVFLVLCGFLFKGLYLDPRKVPSALIDKPAPEFVLPQLDESAPQIKKADLLGKVYLLNVWASWCESCRYEHPFLNDRRDRRHDPADQMSLHGCPLSRSIAYDGS